MTAEQLAELVIEAPGPPIVTAAGVASEPAPAALLAWGRTSTGGWAAGIAFLYRHWSRRALVTMWVPADIVRPHPGTDYRHVPRVVLAGPADDWPALPPLYPQAGPDWTAAHVHAARPSPTGGYGAAHAPKIDNESM
jgi:hypothetical protein